MHGDGAGPRRPEVRARSWRRLLQDFRQVTTAEFLVTALKVDPGSGGGHRRGALRLRRSGPRRLPRPARRPVADALAEETVRLAGRRMDGAARHPQQRLGAHLHRGDDGRLRRHRLVPTAAQRHARRLGEDARLGARPRLERPPRHRGRRRRRGRAGGRVRLPAARVSQPPVPGPRRRHLRGHHGALRGRHPGGHAAGALRRRRQRRRPGPAALAQLGSDPLPQRRDRPLHSGPGRLPLRAPPAGCGHGDGDRRLRPRRVPRPVPVRLLLHLRRRRQEGGHAHAVLRRDATGRPTSSSATTATGGSSR